MHNIDLFPHIPEMGIILIGLFYLILILLLAGVDQCGDNPIWAFLMMFLTLGTLFLIETIGWLFLVLPAIVVVIIFIVQVVMYINNEW
jgi:hypothetical protein